MSHALAVASSQNGLARRIVSTQQIASQRELQLPDHESSPSGYKYLAAG